MHNYIERHQDFFLRILSIATIAVIAMYVLGCIWVNFHSCRWYDYDMYPDSQVARMMWEQKTFFPDGWTFGNQFYIVATPSLAALLYGIVHNSILAMSLASTINIFLVLFTCYWCFKPFCNRQVIIVALLCMCGGIMLGVRASSSLSLKFIYTQCSYYASYWIVLFLSIGVYLRLKNSIDVSSLLLLFVALLNFGIGMNSLREMAVLNLPLVATEGLLLVFHFFNGKKIEKKNGSKAFSFIILLLCCSALGHILIGLLKVPAFHFVESLQMGSLWLNIKLCFIEICRISGLYFINYVSDGGQFLLLFLAGAINIAVIVCAGINILRSHLCTPLSIVYLFSMISFAGVMVCAFFIIRTSSNYYFVYYLLLSVSYLILFTQVSKQKSIILFSILWFIACLNWFAQFRGDIVEYRRDNNLYVEVYDYLSRQGIDVVFQLNHSPYLGAYSEDQSLTSVQIAYYESPLNVEDQFLFRLPPFFQPPIVTLDLNSSVICISKSQLDYLNKNLSIERKAIFDSWQLLYTVPNLDMAKTVFFYKQTTNTIDYHHPMDMSEWIPL